MGYMLGYGACFSCKGLFSFNPSTVPSYRGAPICEGCITRVNAKRKAAGAPLWPVAANAYEPAECA